MPINQWPETERPREKLLQHGPAALSDAELLAIFLRTGVRGKSALDLARDLLAHFDGIHGLLLASRAQFTGIVGLGDAKFAQLHASCELSRRHMRESLARGDALTSPDTTRKYLVATLGREQREVFWCLFLDSQHRVLASEALFYGTIDGASVYPREVVKASLAHNAAAVIFAHNHPSGVAEPSQADQRITRRLKDALALVDIRTLDHLIVAGNRTVSMAEMGLV